MLSQRITTYVRGQARVFCAQCADTDPDIQAIIKMADSLDIDYTGAEEEKCSACGRFLTDVFVYRGQHSLKLHLTFEIDVQLEAASCTEADYAVKKTLSNGLKLHDIYEQIETVLEEHIPMMYSATIDQCTYQADPAEGIPPRIYDSPA